MIIALWAAFLQARSRGGSGINLTEDCRSVSLASDALIQFDLNKCTCALECSLIIPRPSSDNSTQKNVPLAIFVCVWYVVQEDMTWVSWAAGRGISQTVHNYGADRFADLHPVANTDLGYVKIIYIKTLSERWKFFLHSLKCSTCYLVGVKTISTPALPVTCSSNHVWPPVR